MVSRGTIIPKMEVTIKDVLKNRPLECMARDMDYPSHMPFYLYGTDSQYHISHILLRSPNIALRAGDVKLDLDNIGEVEREIRTHGGVILTLLDIYEVSRQPFPEKNADLPRDFFFRPGQEFRVRVWRDPREAEQSARGLMEEIYEEPNGASCLASGTMKLSEDVHVDAESVNKDIFKRYDKVTRWREEFDQIGRELQPRTD